MPSVFRRKGSPNFYVAFFDHFGRRRERSTRTSDKRAAERIARKIESETALRRAGVVDPRCDHFVAANRRPLTKHIEEYLAHCEHQSQAERHVLGKRGQLTALIKNTGVARLSELDPNLVQRHLCSLRESGRSARTVNSHRATIVAFANWAVTTGKIPENRLAIIPTLDDRKDRRRERRALTDDELACLIASARERDEELADDGKGYCPRSVIYLVAARTGLRRSEMGKLCWGDVDLEGRSILVRIGVGKAVRDDLIPLHDQVVRSLREIRPAHPMPTVKVFWSMPTIATFYRDLERARERWISEGNPEGTDYLAKRDSADRWVDFHSLRKTFATALVRANVTPQTSREIMRHADVRTTMTHYVDLRLRDLAAAIGAVPDVEGVEASHFDDHQRRRQQDRMAHPI